MPAYRTRCPPVLFSAPCCLMDARCQPASPLDASCKPMPLWSLPSSGCACPRQFCVLLYHLLIAVARREQYRDVTAVGYSCVLFGWMTLLATKQPGEHKRAGALARRNCGNPLLGMQAPGRQAGGTLLLSGMEEGASLKWQLRAPPGTSHDGGASGPVHCASQHGPSASPLLRAPHPSHQPPLPCRRGAAGGISVLPLFGLADLPMWAAPWSSLLITSLLVPKARQAARSGWPWGGGVSSCACQHHRPTLPCIPLTLPRAPCSAPPPQLCGPPGGHPGWVCRGVWPLQLAHPLVDPLPAALVCPGAGLRRGPQPAANDSLHQAASRASRPGGGRAGWQRIRPRKRRRRHPNRGRPGGACLMT